MPTDLATHLADPLHAIPHHPPCTQPDWAALVPERAALVRFARRRLQDPTLAEDLVHDVFEAVASGRARFDGRASLRTWLTAILKNKIVDLVRSRRGHGSLDHTWDSDDGGGAALELECPQPRPDDVAAQRQRLRRTLALIETLPQTLRQAFERRVLADEDSGEVCRALGISENNLFVRLHRARALLAAA
jgi:RNA polymerase sigma-70 factor (ECF subfamily)